MVRSCRFSRRNSLRSIGKSWMGGDIWIDERLATTCLAMRRTGIVRRADALLVRIWTVHAPCRRRLVGGWRLVAETQVVQAVLEVRRRLGRCWIYRLWSQWSRLPARSSSTLCWHLDPSRADLFSPLKCDRWAVGGTAGSFGRTPPSTARIWLGLPGRRLLHTDCWCPSLRLRRSILRPSGSGRSALSLQFVQRPVPWNA